MAQSGYTPISIYYSATATNVPLAANLTSGELGINIADGKLYYKDNAGTVQVLASKAGNINVSSISFGTTGLTPSTTTTGAVTVAGTLVVSNGGTGQTTLATGSIGYGQGTSAHAALAIGTAGQVLTVNSGATAPQWVNASSIIGGAGGSNTQVQYNSSGSLAGSANMVFDGSTLTTLNAAYTGTLTGGTGIVNLGSGQFYKDASGNVGIGTSSPNSPAGSTQTTLHISNSTTSTSPGIHLTNGDTGTTVGDGTLLFVGNAASTGTTSFNIYNQESSPICLFTATTERMRIDSSGNVGIGTSSPTGKLNIAQTGTSDWIHLTNTATTGDGSHTCNISSFKDGVGFSNIAFDASKYTFKLIGLTDAMTLDVGGNLLVGTTAQFNNCKVGISADISSFNIFSIRNSGGGTGTYVGFLNSSNSTVGSISYNGSLTLYNTTSDYRLKKCDWCYNQRWHKNRCFRAY